jgi:catechol 2,3-dioxygenase-like lactoylglutathione lyase family enzyme
VTIQRKDHVGVVVDDLEAAISFFVELGMELDGGTTPVEGDWVDSVVGFDEVRVEIAFVRTPDGYGRLELTKFHNPPATTAEPNAPANTFGLRRVMFAATTSTTSLPACELMAPSSSVRWRDTRISIGSATSAAPMASSSHSPNSSAEPSVAHLQHRLAAQ